MPGDLYRLRFGNSADWAGFSVTDSDVIIRCTWYADATLDQMVDILDLYHLASHWHTATPYWFYGDFDFSGTVDAVDLGMLATRWQSGVSFATALAMYGL